MALTNINFMMEMIMSYLDRKIDRTTFELDFVSNLNSRYKKMLREDRDIAEWFYDCIVHDAMNRGHDLSDQEFVKVLRAEYDRVKDLVDNGVW